jgi:hypothetical protein
MLLSFGVYEGEAGRQQLLQKALSAQSYIADVYGRAAAKGLKILGSWDSRIASTVSYIRAWEGDTDAPHTYSGPGGQTLSTSWDKEAVGFNVTIDGVLKNVKEFDNTILKTNATVNQSTTSGGTLIVNTRVPTPMQVAQQTDAVISKLPLIIAAGLLLAIGWGTLVKK